MEIIVLTMIIILRITVNNLIVLMIMVIILVVVGKGSLNGLFECSVPALSSYFYTTFLKDYGRGESRGTITCLKTVVVSKQRHAPCEILLLHEASFCVSPI